MTPTCDIEELRVTIPENVLMLAGFTLAHALWSVSDLVDGLLIPLAILETGEGRKLMRFVAQEQYEAIDKGKTYLSKLDPGVKAWAFAREGLMPEGSGRADVITVEFWAQGMEEPIMVIQPFEPYANRQTFRVLGIPDVAVDDVILDPAESAELVDVILLGVQSHSKVATLWSNWSEPCSG